DPPWLSPRRRSPRPRAAATRRRHGGWAGPPAACARTARLPRPPTWSVPAAAGTRGAKPSRSTDLSRRGERPSPGTLATLPVAVDAMGGDKSPGEIVEGARRAADENGIPIVLVGPPEQVGDTLGLPLVACTEVIAMDEDPAGGVRRKKDSSLVRAAELVRDGKASAMVSAGNTGATMAAALLRMGRLPGVIRPCIATPLPRLGRAPAVLVDAGANAECTPAMLVQFTQMGAAYASARWGTEAPSVGLLSIGEEATKGTPLVKETHKLLAAAAAGGGA